MPELPGRGKGRRGKKDRAANSGVRREITDNHPEKFLESKTSQKEEI